MPEYTVSWIIDLDADDPTDAARKALKIHRDPESIATLFVVEGDTGTYEIDLDQRRGS